MHYLSKYNLNNEDIDYLEKNLNTSDYQEFLLKEEKIKTILNYFQEIGITNIKEIIFYKPNIFYDSLKSIKEAFEENKIENLIDLINEDANNLDLIGY